MPSGVYGKAKEWTPEDHQNLRELWDEGHSAAEIGRRMGRSKNAVVGSAHRLGLKARPSPIPSGRNVKLTEQSFEEIALMQSEGISLKQIALRLGVSPGAIWHGMKRRNIAPVKFEPKAVRRVTLPALPSTVVERIKPVRPEPIRVYARVVECCWPIGEPRRAGFRFCCEPSKPGAPYCHTHCAQAYVRKSPISAHVEAA